MAMIKCTECAFEVSHEAATCPQCGVKSPILTAEQRLQLDQQGRWISIVIFFACLIALIAIFKKIM